MPQNEATVLKRFGHKGQFVAYPKEWGRRMVHTGLVRYDTSCDLIVGHCACGERHTEEEGWVRESLDSFGQRVESMDDWLKRTRRDG